MTSVATFSRSTAICCGSVARLWPSRGPREGGRIDGSVLGPDALLLRFFADEPADERLLLVNLGADLSVASVPDPLFAPPAGSDWHLVWSSEDPAMAEAAGARSKPPGASS